MCGGVKEFESMRAPAPQQYSLLHEEIRQYACGERSYVDESVCYVPVMKLSKPRDQIIKTRHEQVVDAEAARPAGLAIVAAMIGREPVQSGRATKSGNSSGRHISVEQSQSGASARAGRMVKSAGRQGATDGRPAGCGSLKGEKARRKSVFYSAFSPPKDYILDSRSAPPFADFMGTCFLCKRSLGSGMDIYMYRGDRAFCSNECRYQHMVDEQNLPIGEPAHCNDKFASPSPIIPVLG